MAISSETPPCSLTIFLLRDNITSASDALRELDSLKHLQILEDGKLLCDLYIQKSTPHLPSWGTFFENYIDLGELGRVSTSSAVLLVAADNRLFAVTFGQGRHLLNPGVYEERFGLRVVLNSINENSIRSIDKKTFDAISTHTRVQSSREAEAKDFGLDIEQDLLRAATGVPKDTTLGKRLSGMDSLHVAVRVRLGDLGEHLEECLDRFHDDSYRRTFPWVDHIAEVSNPHITASLDDLVIQGIIAGNSTRCWLAVPEIIDWGSIKGFRYKAGAKEPEYHDLHLADFLKTVDDKSNITPALLRKRYVTSIDMADHRQNRWSIYQCLYCEIEQDGNTYLLTGGKWYRVSRDFVDNVNGFVKSLPRYERRLPEYNDTSEAEYCVRVATQLPDEFALMDRNTIPIGGMYNKIEFCDLYSNSGDIIHIKRYASSSVLSHLFSQGVVSGEAFRSDQMFRKAVNERLPVAHQISHVESSFDPTKYQVVFAVVSDQLGDLTLPFFSRVNLKHAATRLQSFGYRTVLAKIKVGDRLAKKRRYKST